MTDAEIGARLAPGETADDVLLAVLAALGRAGHETAVTDAYGVGAEVAAELRLDGGRRVRIAVQEW